MNRVEIGKHFDKQPLWKVFIGVPLIYLPLILTIPFVAIGAFIVKTHLQLCGAKNITPFKHFIPAWASHRYNLSSQIIYSTGAHWYNLRHHKLYWIFNCKMYCPTSVALFRYMVYLVKIVENWWCPFDHDQKQEYKEGAIDCSYWHLHEQEEQRMDPDDRMNPIWNESGNTKPDKYNEFR